MIGIVVVAHGYLGQALLASAEMIIGAQDNVHAICLNQDGNLASLQEEVKRVVQAANRGQGVLMMVDMFGGTPANAAASAQSTPECQCLCGVNLPMLLETLVRREQMTVGKLTAHVERLACESVVNLKSALERSLGTPTAGGQ